MTGSGALGFDALPGFRCATLEECRTLSLSVYISVCPKTTQAVFASVGFSKTIMTIKTPHVDAFFLVFRGMSPSDGGTTGKVSKTVV